MSIATLRGIVSYWYVCDLTGPRGSKISENVLKN